MTMGNMTMGGNMSMGGNAAYPCPEGYLLTYVEQQRTYPNISFSTLLQTAVGFQNATYFGC
jgi:hypothetical protein